MSSQIKIRLDLGPAEAAQLEQLWSVRALRALHLTVLLFVLFGWALPNFSVRALHLLFVPLLVLHWRSNGGTCALSRAENALKLRELERRHAQPIDPQSLPRTEPGHFIKSILRLVCSPLPADRWIKFGLYCALILAWSLSVGLLALGSG